MGRIREPAVPSNAGSRVSAASMSSSTTDRPATPMERRKASGKTSRLPSEAATVRPENSTVRPALTIVRSTAVGRSSSAPRSSRKRDTMSRA